MGAVTDDLCEHGDDAAHCTFCESEAGVLAMEKRQREAKAGRQRELDSDIAKKLELREERQRLVWLGFYNTAAIQWSIGQVAGQNPAWSIREQADAMLEKYNERWENDD